MSDGKVLIERMQSVMKRHIAIIESDIPMAEKTSRTYDFVRESEEILREMKNLLDINKSNGE